MRAEGEFNLKKDHMQLKTEPYFVICIPVISNLHRPDIAVEPFFGCYTIPVDQ